MIYQVIVGLIFFAINGSPQKSPNTERLMVIAKQMPVFIILISIVGPILEEFVFRRYFSEKYIMLLKGLVS